MKIATAWIPAGLLENPNHGSKPVNQNLCETMYECGSSAPALEENHRAKTDFPRKNNFVNFSITLVFFDYLDKGRRNWNALRPRGPFLFRSAGKGSKRCRFARHFGSGEIKPRSNPFGEPSQTQRLTAFQTHGKDRFCPCRARQGQKSPHEPRRMALPRPAGSCLTAVSGGQRKVSATLRSPKAIAPQ